MKYIPEGPLYELWLEESLEINTSFEKKAEQLPFVIKFYWNMKVNVFIRETPFLAKKKDTY